MKYLYVPLVDEQGLVYLENINPNNMNYNFKEWTDFLPNLEGKPYIFKSHVEAIQWVFDNVKDELIDKSHDNYKNINPIIYRSWYLKDPNTP